MSTQTADESTVRQEQTDERTYRRRKLAWALYDWANSAFATTILAAILPTYYSTVAGKGLAATDEASRAIASGYWSATLSISLLIVAILSPILGTIADIMRGKKRFMAIFVGMGIVGTGLLVLVSTGDWLLASILFLVGRVGFASADVFYNALLPHVAKPDEVDRLSTQGYALGYLGGGLLLAINIAMIQMADKIGLQNAEIASRASFLSVAIWWGLFSIPLFRTVPEPPAAAITDRRINPISASFKRLSETFRDIRRYRELMKFLIAFWLYNDGIGTIIGVAAIYGSALGLGTTEIVGALLLVQFVGIPFSLIFGNIPSPKEPRRAFFLAFILWNLITIPLLGIAGRGLLPPEIAGAPLPPYESTDTAIGTGLYEATEPVIERAGEWETETLGGRTYIYSTDADATLSFRFNGQGVNVARSLGPDRGIAEIYVDGELWDEVDNHAPFVHPGAIITIDGLEEGEHEVEIRNTGHHNPASTGTRIDLGSVEVLPPPRSSDLVMIVGALLADQVVGLLLAWLVGARLAQPWAESLTTKRAIILALVVYTVIAIWGFVLDSVMEFWLLAWMVGVVQGGSQALSRSLYASMVPKAKSGEFFGFFSVSAKFAGIVGPLIFSGVIALTAALMGTPSPRPAVLSIVLFFIVGIILLSRVNEEEGRRVAESEDAAWLRSAT